MSFRGGLGRRCYKNVSTIDGLGRVVVVEVRGSPYRQVGHMLLDLGPLGSCPA